MAQKTNRKFNKMRIVHLLFNLRVGGTETMLLDIMSNQAKLGADVFFILINKEQDPYLLSRVDQKIKTIFINRPDGSKNPWWAIILNHQLQKIAPDIIHCHNVKAIGLVFKRKNVKLVFTAHCMGIANPLLKRADLICSISDAVKQDLRNRLNLESTIIYNGISVSKIAHAKTNNTSNKFKIIQVGRLDHSIKGQDITIKAIALLKEKYGLDNIYADFYGFGPSKDMLIELAKEHGLEDRIYIPGTTIKHEDLCTQLKNYNMLILPSRDEGFGLTIAEGMAAKLPVLVSNIPGPMEVVGNGQYGSVFESEDINDCADKIYDIITNPNKYQNLASNEAYDFLKSNFDIEITAKRYCDKYIEIMSKTKSSPSIKMDLYRYSGNTRLKSFLKHYFLSPGFRITVWFRLASKFNGPFGAILNLILMHYRYLFGIDLKRNTKIGKGFYIGHFSGIVISSTTVIGDNCNISQGVTIGVAGKGENRGCPTIGNNVYIGAGAKIIGKIAIGNNVAIGANAVVTKDVPDNAVVGGIPAKIISMDGASEILTNCI